MSTPHASSPPSTAKRRGVLLLNLGSPDSTEVDDVRRYLREFLGDPRVIDIPGPVRRAILELFILPFRPAKSAEAYKEIWTEEGSPLITMTYRCAELLQARLASEEVVVEVGMRYGNPSTEEAVRRLKARGVEDVLAIPLYPHYAMSSYETAVAKVQEVFAQLAPELTLTVEPPYFDDPDYIAALRAVAAPILEEQKPDLLLFSYHGVPERHIKKADPSGCYCLNYANCCEREHPAHALCYRHQCFVTTRELSRALGLDKDRYRLAFQSRLGRDPWLTPYTDQELERLPSQGIKHVAVICPAFVSDCLETLEEIDMRGRETFLNAGGKSFSYIPCVNDHPRWIDVLEKFSRRFLDLQVETHDVIAKKDLRPTA